MENTQNTENSNQQHLTGKKMKETQAYQHYLKEIEYEHQRLRQDIPFFSRKSWEDYIYKTPCAKQSFLTAIGTSSIMVAHQLRLYKGKGFRAFLFGLASFAFTMNVTFSLCTDEMIRKHTLMRYALRLQNIKPLEQRKVDSEVERYK